MIIAVMIAVPAMVVLAAAVFSVPVAGVKAFAVMTMAYPARTLVGRPCPIALMPPITTSYGIPVTAYPDITWPGAYRLDSYHSRRWGRPDPDSDSDLSAANR